VVLFIAFLAACLVAVGTIGWFYGRQSVKDESLRRWGDKLRREIEDAGGVDAWKRAKAKGAPPPAAPGPAVVAQAAQAVSAIDHPLDGTLLTARGVWTVMMLTDEDDGRTRRFVMNLLPPHATEAEAVPFIVRVPRTVIVGERAQSWAADLRAQLAVWINADAIRQGEMIWWPDLSPAE
jgi:hypothetical protein